MSSNEYEFAVGRELSEGHSRDLIVNERLQASPGGGVPNLARPVVASGDDERPIAVEVHGGHGKGVSPDDVKALPGLHLPDTNRFVEGTGDNEVGLGIEIDTEHKAGVTAEGLHALAGGGACVPDAEGTVVGGGADVVRVGGPGEVGDALGVTKEALDEGEGGRRPDDDALVQGSGG